MVNVLVRDFDLGVVDRLYAHRLEIVADGLPLFGGGQLAIDTTLVYGTPRRGAPTRDGAALTEARRRKARTYPELTGQGGRARLVVLAGETGGRWSNETAPFLSSLAHAKSREVPAEMQESARAAWRRRWASVVLLLGRTHCHCLMRASPGADGDVPNVHDVVGDHFRLRAQCDGLL